MAPTWLSRSPAHPPTQHSGPCGLPRSRCSKRPRRSRRIHPKSQPRDLALEAPPGSALSNSPWRCSPRPAVCPGGDLCRRHHSSAEGPQWIGGRREKWADGPTLWPELLLGSSSLGAGRHCPPNPGRGWSSPHGSLAPLSTHASVQTLCPLPPAERLSGNLLPADTLMPTRPFQPRHPLLSCFPGSLEEPTAVPGLPSVYAVPPAWDTLPRVQHQAAVPFLWGLSLRGVCLGAARGSLSVGCWPG